MESKLEELQEKKKMGMLIWFCLFAFLGGSQFLNFPEGHIYWWIVFGIFLGGCLLNVIFITRIKDQIEQCNDDINSCKQKRDSAIKQKYDIFCKNYGCLNNAIRNYDKNIWIYNGILYEAENFQSYLGHYKDVKYDCEDIPTYNVVCKVIPVANIQYYAKEGDVQYTSRISGGGGGGSSIAGALVGGAIAGNTGAIIGSRKKVNDIKTTTERHDSRTTIVRYFENQSIKTLNYSGFGVYDYLLTQIPNKDLLTMQLNHSSGVVVPRVEESQDVKDKLKKLQDLYNSGLITDVEYANKRQNLLNDL